MLQEVEIKGQGHQSFKVKGPASLKFPEFARPENYRKWKTAVREEMIRERGSG